MRPTFAAIGPLTLIAPPPHLGHCTSPLPNEVGEAEEEWWWWWWCVRVRGRVEGGRGGCMREEHVCTEELFALGRATKDSCVGVSSVALWVGLSDKTSQAPVTAIFYCTFACSSTDLFFNTNFSKPLPSLPVNLLCHQRWMRRRREVRASGYGWGEAEEVAAPLWVAIRGRRMVARSGPPKS